MTNQMPRVGTARRWTLILALLAVAVVGWVTRYDVQQCSGVGCVMVNRWTGEVIFKPAVRR